MRISDWSSDVCSSDLQEIISGRENHMAVAAILLAFAVLCAGGAALMLTQDKRRPSIIFGAGGGILLLGAIVVFFTRPGFSSIDDRAALLAPEAAGAAEASFRSAGLHICHKAEPRRRTTERAPCRTEWASTCESRWYLDPNIKK